MSVHEPSDLRTRHEVAVLVMPGALPLDVGIPLQVFIDRPGVPYALSICAEHPGAVAAASGLSYQVERGLEALGSADTIVVPGYSPPDRQVSAPVREALVAAHERGARLVSICYGAFALADAGLLSGRRATTHWDAAAQLARTHPDVDVDPNVLFVDEGSVLTSAGVAAGLDLCLYIVRKDLGPRTANEIARRLVASPRRAGGQAQYQPTGWMPVAGGEELEEVRTWALAHLDDDLTTQQMADRARMSRRTFERRFVEETGRPPHRWILGARVDLARRLLEDSDLPIDQIASRAGLGTGANLRLHFRRALGTSPAEYRKTFSATLTQ
ncbi:helix-turn-helix domain-containing protein [Brachybacterium sp. MASK1Z-5]|uniref:Helix-turn-helix domain-containing protein n=1 Tax=Brachybacterium halotolerans TaxID=2795215 RepID=A0ABS1B9Z2_9MICO|nr:helix-turn-helix domain-containing protein [Brachybacterium halotolerans]MBK0331451.1 helix-turn-helix domain-containing protein [Brachybacterium halotolerans]